MKSSANFGHAQVNTWPHVRAARDPAAPGGQASGSRPAMVGRSSDFGHTRRASPRTEEDLDTILYHVPVRSLCVRPYDKRTELGPNSSQSARRDPLRGRIARPAGRIACIAGSPMDVRSEYTNGNTEGHRSSVECRCSARQGGSAFVIEQASRNTLLYIVCKSQYGFATVKNVNSTPYTYFSHGMLLSFSFCPRFVTGAAWPPDKKPNIPPNMTAAPSGAGAGAASVLVSTTSASFLAK